MSLNTTRQFMGIAKKDQIQRMCELPSVMVANHCTPIDGVADTMGQLRFMDIKIGSTTGYVKEIMDVILPVIKQINRRLNNGIRHGIQARAMLYPGSVDRRN